MEPGALQIRLDDLRDPRIAVFLNEHLADMRRVTPPESVYALDLQGLQQPSVRFWSAWLPEAGAPDGHRLAATAALRQLDAAHAELKSMRTASGLRGRGIAQTLLQHVLAQARAQGCARLSLETGNHAFFEPARQLYARNGFEACGPFGSYGPDPTSYFMTRRL